MYVLDAVCALVFIFFLCRCTRRSSARKRSGTRCAISFPGCVRLEYQGDPGDHHARSLRGAARRGDGAAADVCREILHVGPTGYGWLRAAQSFGAVGMAFALAHLPPMRHAGWTLLLAVAGYGAATAVFGLSHWYWLSLLAWRSRARLTMSAWSCGIPGAIAHARLDARAGRGREQRFHRLLE